MESSLVTYHSQFCKFECETAAGIPILPLRQMGTGPAPKSDESVDIIDEAITLFRSTILFKNFSPKGPADKVIVYLTVFIQKCLQEIGRKGMDCKEEVAKPIVTGLAKEMVPSSDDQAFYMRQLGLLSKASGGEEKRYKDYMKQLKEECAKRLLETIYAYGAMDLKFWLAFGKKYFLSQRFNTN